MEKSHLDLVLITGRKKKKKKKKKTLQRAPTGMGIKGSSKKKELL
jgi:hypothetical protein